MPADLGSHLLHKGLDAHAGELRRCASCRRTPLPGELLDVFAHGRVLCALCARADGGRAGEPLRRERVHASARPLAVVPRAA